MREKWPQKMSEAAVPRVLAPAPGIRQGDKKLLCVPPLEHQPEAVVPQHVAVERLQQKRGGWHQKFN